MTKSLGVVLQIFRFVFSFILSHTYLRLYAALAIARDGLSSSQECAIALPSIHTAGVNFILKNYFFFFQIELL